MVCVTQHLEGSRWSPSALLNYSIVEINKPRREASPKSKIGTEILITNITMHLAQRGSAATDGCRSLFISKGKRKEDFINQMGNKHLEIILELQGQQDLNVCFFLFEEPWAFISGLI